MCGGLYPGLTTDLTRYSNSFVPDWKTCTLSSLVRGSKRGGRWMSLAESAVEAVRRFIRFLFKKKGTFSSGQSDIRAGAVQKWHLLSGNRSLRNRAGTTPSDAARLMYAYRKVMSTSSSTPARPLGTGPRCHSYTLTGPCTHLPGDRYIFHHFLDRNITTLVSCHFS
ncbi:hypothetical protein J6590_009145 [Homalodisca vitripennis]|nr:hypothetical protein J6590_009145 [Homalodisca vitripennis]